MKTKEKKKQFVANLFQNYAFRIIFDDPKLSDVKKIFISKKLFKGIKNNGKIIIYFFSHKKVELDIDKIKSNKILINLGGRK
ncbi:hypothetical protein [Fusobacterium sp. SYSU M8D902]|uniref:hypothetical protein n=1 Tax=Fusobacterium sp. SYSU M8D902 TaxID=3159562 RepID=UPI0032E3D872